MTSRLLQCWETTVYYRPPSSAIMKLLFTVIWCYVSAPTAHTQPYLELPTFSNFPTFLWQTWEEQTLSWVFFSCSHFRPYWPFCSIIIIWAPWDHSLKNKQRWTNSQHGPSITFHVDTARSVPQSVPHCQHAANDISTKPQTLLFGITKTPCQSNGTRLGSGVQRRIQKTFTYRWTV